MHRLVRPPMWCRAAAIGVAIPLLSVCSAAPDTPTTPQEPVAAATPAATVAAVPTQDNSGDTPPILPAPTAATAQPAKPADPPASPTPPPVPATAKAVAPKLQYDPRVEGVIPEARADERTRRLRVTLDPPMARAANQEKVAYSIALMTRILAQRITPVKRCYESIAYDLGASGTALIVLKVEEDGSVSGSSASPAIAATELVDRDLMPCIAGALRRARFPSHKHGRVTIFGRLHLAPAL